jgi:putative heme-binding domain-containing protein
MIRVYHSPFGADHGYPYLYDERPDEALAPLADLGRGSSAGGVAYEERQFPASYRGSLFFCEWGKAVVRYQPEARGAGFGPLGEIPFAVGAETDPYGFKPTDLVVDRDGSLVVADWADGQSPKRGRGRIYRIAAVGMDVGRKRAQAPGRPTRIPEPPDNSARSQSPFPTMPRVARLDSESLYERIDAQEALEDLGAEGLAAVREALRDRHLGVHGRFHAIWALVRAGGAAATEELLALARSDPDPRVREQAVRALGDLVDPILVRHRLEAGPGDAELAARLAAWARGQDPRVLREVFIVLGRLRWAGVPDWLRGAIPQLDPTLAHLAMQALRRSENWTGILGLVNLPSDEPARTIALRALADRAEPVVVDGLIARLHTEPEAARRGEYADLLARVWKRPGPWTYWGYRPAPRPANTVGWERTEAIARALEDRLDDPSLIVRLAVLRRMRREAIPIPERFHELDTSERRLVAAGEALRAFARDLDANARRTGGAVLRLFSRGAVRAQPRAEAPERAALTQAALVQPGDPLRGRALFYDAARSRCITCHRVGDQGERTGPDLTGVGDRFPRIYLIESILEPNRAIAPAYQTVVVALKDGRVLSGVKVAESDEALTLGDAEGQQLRLARADIDETHSLATSLMPEGLEKTLTREEFVDLIAFLASLKDKRPR